MLLIGFRSRSTRQSQTQLIQTSAKTVNNIVTGYTGSSYSSDRIADRNGISEASYEMEKVECTET